VKSENYHFFKRKRKYNGTKRIISVSESNYQLNKQHQPARQEASEVEAKQVK
jgi:hypothetical protein